MQPAKAFLADVQARKRQERWKDKLRSRQQAQHDPPLPLHAPDPLLSAAHDSARPSVGDASNAVSADFASVQMGAEPLIPPDASLGMAGPSLVQPTASAHDLSDAPALDSETNSLSQPVLQRNASKDGQPMEMPPKLDPLNSDVPVDQASAFADTMFHRSSLSQQALPEDPSISQQQQQLPQQALMHPRRPLQQQQHAADTSERLRPVPSGLERALPPVKSPGHVQTDKHDRGAVGAQSLAVQPATGTELMLVEDGQDGDGVIMTAEEGERERALLADRYLAVQVFCV